MSHPFRSSAKATSRGKFQKLTGKAGKSGGDSGSSQMRSPTDAGVEAGRVKGDQAEARIDKRARGGRTGSKLNINIISLPHGDGQAAPPPITPPLPMGAAAAPQPGLPPVLPAPGGGAPPPGPEIPMRKRGGMVKMTGGAEGGLGRIQKAKNAKRMRGG